MSKDGGSAKRFVLLGTDCVYPRTTHKILRAFLKCKGVADADKVIAAMAGQTFPAPGGFVSPMNAKNCQLHKPVSIGEIKADGQFNVERKTRGPVKAEPWSAYIREHKGKQAEPEKK